MQTELLLNVLINFIVASTKFLDIASTMWDHNNYNSKYCGGNSLLHNLLKDTCAQQENAYGL